MAKQVVLHDKLSNWEVCEAYQRVKRGGECTARVAAEYGVSRQSLTWAFLRLEYQAMKRGLCVPAPMAMRWCQ
jgi:hypothetical protein